MSGDELVAVGAAADVDENNKDFAAVAGTAAFGGCCLPLRKTMTSLRFRCLVVRHMQICLVLLVGRE